VQSSGTVGAVLDLDQRSLDSSKEL
jgi:hypothetical protein